MVDDDPRERAGERCGFDGERVELGAGGERGLIADEAGVELDVSEPGRELGLVVAVVEERGGVFHEGLEDREGRRRGVRSEFAAHPPALGWIGRGSKGGQGDLDRHRWVTCL
ncbi:MAG: hypothetical protein R3F65_12330 [bacterium]